MRRTKIIATLGPSTDDPATLAKLFTAGVDVVRLNFSHGDADTREKRVRTVREVAEQCGKYVAVLGDLQGPKIRIQRFRDGPVSLVEGKTFVLDAAMDPLAGTADGVGVVRDLRMETLDRHALAGRAPRAVDDPHAPTANDRLDAVA